MHCLGVQSAVRLKRSSIHARGLLDMVEASLHINTSVPAFFMASWSLVYLACSHSQGGLGFANGRNGSRERVFSAS